MWVCRTKAPALPLEWASPTDMSGSYGLTKVECQKIVFEGSFSPSFSDYRSWTKVLQVIRDVIWP